MKKGIPTVIKTTSWVESHYNGNDIQERIRNFIKDAYTKWGIDYVLLGGDDEIVPTRIATLNFYGLLAPFIATDLYYACLDGNWNADGDEYFGEILDSVDLYPEVVVGRLPVNNGDEADAFISKILNYEKNPANEFMYRTLFLGENMFSPGDGKMFCDSIADFHFPYWYLKTRLYEIDGNENRNTVMNALNTGQGIIYYQGHGSTNTLGVGPDYLYKMDFDTLSNGNMQSIWYGISCNINRFTCDCISEHFVRSSNGGGVAFIASTTNDYPFDNFEFDKSFFDFFFDSSYYKIGDVLTLSKASHVGYYQYWQPYISAMYGRMLLGDPEMLVWTDQPQLITVNHATSVGLGPSDFLIEVRKSIGAPPPPLEGAKVCVMKDDEFFAYDYTNAQGLVSFEICPESAGDISVVVTKHNYSTYEGICEVEIDIPYVSYMDHSVDDNSGNADGLVDAGEDIFLTLTLKNSGFGNADDVNAILRTESSYITILDSVEYFGQIQAGQFAAKENAYRILVDANSSDQTEIKFNLSITALQGNYDDNFDIEVFAPLLSHSGHSVFGNQPYKMRLKIRNDGCGKDKGVWALLDSDDPDVTIIKDSIWIDTINGRSEEASSQVFQFESSVHPDSISDLRVVINDVYHREVSDTFVIASPRAPYNLVYQPYQDKIHLAWDVVPYPLYGFNVYRQLYGQPEPIKLTETPITNGRYFTDFNLYPGTKYYYMVTTVDSSMNESFYSTQLLTATNPKLKTGWPQTMEFDPGYLSPFACELDPTYSGLEVVSVDRFGTIYAWHCDGTGLLSPDGVFARTNMGSWTSPAAADIDLDGQIEIVYMASKSSPGSTKVFVYKPNGTLMWSTPVGPYSSISSPVIGQFDYRNPDDPELEIIASLTNGDIYVLQHNGSNTLIASCSSTVYSSPALGDVDDNGNSDVWIGTKGGIYAWDEDLNPITPFVGWPGGEYHDFSSIVIGDVTIASSGYEIVTVDRYIGADAYVIDKDGNCLSGWPTYLPTWDLLLSPSLANLDNDLDNELELIIGSDPDIFVFNNDGSVVDGFPANRLKNVCSNPVIADIDNDQDYEIIVGSGGEDYRYYGYHHNGEQVLGFPIHAIGAVATPFIGDIDNDNKLEMIVSCHEHKVYVYELDESNNYTNSCLWPTFRHDLARTGNYSTSMLAQPEYTLTIYTIGQGTVTQAPNSPTYIEGTVCTLTAVPDSHWVFDHWSDSLSGSNNPETITMDSDKIVTANFIPSDYVLNLDSFPMYEAKQPYKQMCGSAVAQMALNYMFWNNDSYPAGPPMLPEFEQDLLYTYGINHNADPNLEYFDLQGMWHTIQYKKPMPYSEYGYNFTKRHSADQYTMLKLICQWIDYPVGTVSGDHKEGHPWHVPSVVPAYGDYTNWMAVRGIHTDVAAYPMPDTLIVYGFWVNDPFPGGIGENSYKTAQEFVETYYDTLDTGDFQGEYVAVLEPPESVEGCELIIAQSIPRFNKQQINVHKGAVPGQDVIPDDLRTWIIQAAIDGVTEELIPYDKNFETVFKTTIPGKPMLVTNIGEDNYYIVPFNLRRPIPKVIEKDKNIINTDIKTDNKSIADTRVTTKSQTMSKHEPIASDKTQVEINSKDRNVLVEILKNTVVVVLIHSQDGSFKEASWTHTPVKYLPISKEEARQIAFDTAEELGLEIDNINDLQPELIYRQSTPYYPEWRVVIGEYAIYISQDGSVSVEEWVQGEQESGGVMSEEGTTSFAYLLKTAAPTPFVDNTTIYYSIAKFGNVCLNIYDISGRFIKILVDEKKNAGMYSARWDGYDDNNQKVANGVYFTRVTSGDFTAVKKIILVR